VISESKLKWMGVLTCDADWVHEFVMLFVDQLVHWEPLMFAVQHSVGQVEAKVFNDNQEKEVASKLPSVWGTFNIEPPWELPVVAPRSKCEATEVYDNIVKNAVFESFFNQFSPGDWILLPWPWNILFNFILFKEGIFSSVKDPVKPI